MLSDKPEDDWYSRRSGVQAAGKAGGAECKYQGASHAASCAALAARVASSTPFERLKAAGQLIKLILHGRGPPLPSSRHAGQVQLSIRC